MSKPRRDVDYQSWVAFVQRQEGDREDDAVLVDREDALELLAIIKDLKAENIRLQKELRGIELYAQAHPRAGVYEALDAVCDDHEEPSHE